MKLRGTDRRLAGFLLLSLSLGLGLLAFLLRPPATPPPTKEACLEIAESRRKRQECFIELGEFNEARAAALEQKLAGQTNPVENDLERLSLAAEVPSISNILCTTMETPDGQRLCTRVAQRPHLFSLDGEWALRDKATSGTTNSQDTTKKNRSDAGTSVR